MAWAISKVNGYTLATEVVTFGAGTTDEQFTSAIEFIGKDKDFMVAVDDGTGTTIAFDVHVNVSFDGTNYYEIKSDLIANVAANGTAAALYDVSANGAAPYYKIAVEKDSGSGTNAITVIVTEVG